MLANMSMDSWVPKRFGALSSRLVKQNGVLFFGLFAILILIFSQGNVESLVVLYSVNVFITFSVSLFGLMVYWSKNRKDHWLRSLLLSTLAFLVCVVILVITVATKFFPDGGSALLFTAVVVVVCYYFRRRYKHDEVLKRKLDKSLEINLGDSVPPPVKMSDRDLPTAVFLVHRLGAAVHTILWVERLFPNHFKNYVFLSYGLVDTANFGSSRSLDLLQTHTDRVLNYLAKYASHRGIPSVSEVKFGAQPIEDVLEMSEKVNQSFNNTVYFAARYVYPTETILTRMMHSDFSLMVQRRLQNTGVKMLIIPLQLEI